jgi:hypothetical protein
VIEEIYNKDASLSIHLKKFYLLLCVACNGSNAIEWGIQALPWNETGYLT